MIDIVKRFFSAPDPSVPRDPRVATCAVLLEMAHIDGRFSEEEKKSVAETLKKDYGLSDEELSELMETSQRELEGSVDLWQFTNLINQNYSLEEKLRVIETIWRLAYADGKLDSHEDYLLHKLAALLRLSHKQLIEAKVKVLSEGKSEKRSRSRNA